MAADAAQGLPRREATVCGPGLGGHLRNGPQHVAAQCVGEDVPADALVLARCDEFCDQLGSRWMREGPTHGAGLRKNGPESPTKGGTRQVVRDAACAVAEPGAGSQYEPQPADLHVDRQTEKCAPVTPGQAATTLGVLGGRLANNLPSGFVQRGTGSVESDDGHDGDLRKGTGVSPPGEETPAGG